MPRNLLCALILFFVIGSTLVRAQDEVSLFQPSDYPERLATNICPFDSRSPELENPMYKVTRYDDIEIFAVKVVKPVNTEHRVADILRNTTIDFRFVEFASFKLNVDLKPPRTIGELKRAIERRCVLNRKDALGNNVEARLEVGLTRKKTTVWHSYSEALTDSDVVSIRFLIATTLKTRAVAIQPFEQVPLTKFLSRTRLPAVAFDKCDNALGATWQKLQILTEGVEVFDIVFDQWTFEPGKTTWEDFQNGIASSEPENAAITLAARLLPRWHSYPVPGDHIELFRMESQGLGSGTSVLNQGVVDGKDELAAASNREPRVWQYSMVVDPDGFVWIPPVTSAGDFSNISPPIVMRRNGERDSAFFRVQLWSGNKSRRFTIEEFAVAMSGAGGAVNSHTLSGPCSEAICDSHVFENLLPSQRELSRIRYRAQIADLSWTLVAGGQRLRIPFRRGYRIDSALADGIRQVQYKSIDFGRKNYSVVVVPNADRNPFANEAPFRMEFTPGKQTNPDDALVLPDDTVFLIEP
jgi:hypothetical protein